MPPTSRASAETSPREPPHCPRNILRTLGRSPSEVPSRIASAVALETASALEPRETASCAETQVVIATGQDAIRKARPASAGLMKFLPRPPNRHLAKIIAMPSPMISIQYGSVTGTTKASRVPVTTADRSPIVDGFLRILSYAASNRTQAMIEISVITMARGPNT